MKARVRYLALYLAGRALWVVSDVFAIGRQFTRFQRWAENRGCNLVQAAYDVRDKARRS